MQARSALADLSQQLTATQKKTKMGLIKSCCEDGELVDEAAELLSEEMAGCRQELQEAYERCSKLEAENAELRAERERLGARVGQERSVLDYIANI